MYGGKCTLRPSNVPEARSIENLWGILAQKVYEGGWQARKQQELISRIQSQLKFFTKPDVQCEEKFACHSGK